MPPNAALPGTVTYYKATGGVQQGDGNVFQLPWTGNCSLAPEVGLSARSTMMGLNMYATAENGALSEAATLSIPDAGIIALRGKTWLTSRNNRPNAYNNNNNNNSNNAEGYSTFTPSTGVVDTDAAAREQEEAEKERKRRNRADGRMEMNLLASLLGRAVQVTEGKVTDSPGGGGSGGGGGGGEEGGTGREQEYTGMDAFAMTLFAEGEFWMTWFGYVEFFRLT